MKIYNQDFKVMHQRETTLVRKSYAQTNAFVESGHDALTSTTYTLLK